MSPRRSERLSAIESLVCRDVGRGTQKLIEATRGELAAAAESLARARSVGLITGFYVPRGETPAAETDGPVGAGLLAMALEACGMRTRIATDAPCIGVVRAAAPGIEVDEVADIAGAVRAWQGAGVDCALAIERCGKSVDGKPRNMRGADVSQWTLPLDDLFTGGPWTKLAVGDGGNEIGMGKLAPSLIGATVPNGEAIASVTGCDHLVVAGVSNWGAYGLMAGLAVLRPEWRDRILPFLSAERDLAVTKAVVAAGAVDGVTAKREPTVDGFGADVHGPLIERLRQIACEDAAL
ncbi:MAG TPA: glutamate cyclase domain-containing protein [Reyranella sp.]|nr:glutamate cyclase domain-containing protein [Reyranella sp.]